MVPLVSVEYVRKAQPSLGRWRRTERPRPASRTPEGRYGQCPVCREFVCVTFSEPAGDATCPCCGQLLWRAELRWPFVCEDQGLPLRRPKLRRPRRPFARELGRIVGSVARRLGVGRSRVKPAPTVLPPLSSSAMYDAWLDG